MGLQGKIAATLAITALIAPSVYSANLASAYTDYGNGSYVADCSEIQRVINEEVGNSWSFISLSEDCSASLVIPTGKTITIVGHRLSSDDADTITVQNGATLYLGLEASNSAVGKSIINNSGTTYALGNLTAAPGSYMATNTGELNFGGTDAELTHKGAVFQNSGNIHIAYGNFDNLDNVRPYLISEANIDSNGNVYLPESYEDIITNDKQIASRYIIDVDTMAFGDIATINFTYPEFAAASGYHISSSDPSTIEIRGSNIEGWTITAKNVGVARLVYDGIAVGMGNDIEVVYNAASCDIVPDNVEFMPVNYSMNMRYSNIEVADTLGCYVRSSDDSILEISGNIENGYSLVAKKPGVVSIIEGSTLLDVQASGPMGVYDINADNQGLVNDSVRSYLVNNLTPEQSEQFSDTIARGEVADIELRVVNLGDDVDEDEKKAIEAVAGDNISVVYYFDVKLLISSNGNIIAEISDLGDSQEDTVLITWTDLEFKDVPVGYIRKYYVVRMHNGVTEKINATVTQDGLSVYSGKFGTYAIAYEDLVDPNYTDSTEDDSSDGGQDKKDDEDEANKNSALATNGFLGMPNPPNAGSNTKANNNTSINSYIGLVFSSMLIVMALLSTRLSRKFSNRLVSLLICATNT